MRVFPTTAPKKLYIKDAQRIFWAVIRFLVSSTLFLSAIIFDSLVFTRDKAIDPRGGSVVLGVTFVLGVSFIIATLTLRTNWPGIVYDPAEHSLSFPGGGKLPSGFMEYLSPIYWLQSLRRYTVDLNHVTGIENDVERRGKDFYIYYLVVLGSFGTYKISFRNWAKRDELFALVRSVNRMGIPVVQA